VRLATINDESGFPRCVIARQPDPHHAWSQTNGKPGFVTLAVYEVVGVTIPDDVQEFEPLNGQEPTTNIDEAEATATVFVRWDGKVTIDMYVESTEVGSYHWVLEAITEAIKLGADMTGVDEFE
jgi:hypothetical protein